MEEDPSRGPLREERGSDRLFEPNREVVRLFRRRRRLLIVTFFIPVLVGVLFVSHGMAIDPGSYLGLEGLTWTFIGCLLVAGAALTLGVALICPRCGGSLPLVLLQGTEGESCPSCGVVLISDESRGGV